MARTLSDILIDANAVLDLEASIPSGTELVTRANYANQAIWDAVSKVQLSEFKREFVSTATMATVSLPSDFREPMENPRLLDSTGEWVEYPLKEVEEKYGLAAGKRYSYVLGDPSSGYNLIFNAGLTNATLSFIYQRYPSGLLTLADKCELADPQYVVRKVESYVLYSRSDDRFQEADARANISLADLASREMKGTTGGPKSTKSTLKNPLSGLA